MTARPDQSSYRMVVAPAADWHLTNWARWMRSYQPGLGFRNRTIGIVGYSSETFDDMLDEKDRRDACIADAVLDSLEPRQRAAISNIYLADVWRFRGDPLDVFATAVSEFWRIGQRRGLT